jgi:hypothetical protein
VVNVKGERMGPVPELGFIQTLMSRQMPPMIQAIRITGAILYETLLFVISSVSLLVHLRSLLVL